MHRKCNHKVPAIRRMTAYLPCTCNVCPYTTYDSTNHRSYFCKLVDNVPDDKLSVPRTDGFYIMCAFFDQQDRLWNLFAQHTTLALIILYLVYTQVSAVVSIGQEKPSGQYSRK